MKSKGQGVQGFQLSLFEENLRREVREGIPYEPVSKLVSRLAEQRVSTTSLLDQVMDHENLIKAYKRVVVNGGSSGVDGMEVEALAPWLRDHLPELRRSVLEGTYQVQPVRGVVIEKPDGGMRQLGIPTVIDRLLQQAIHQQLSRYYEPHFSGHSYGYRPGLSSHDAVLAGRGYVQHGKVWMVKVDLKSFFDHVPHDRLMTRLSQGIGDKRLLRLIDAYLKAGMLQGGVSTGRISGTPQGGPLSPLLSNIVLDELDRALEERGHNFCRYADDCVVFVGSRKAGNRVLRWLIEFIERKLKLSVNREKSGVYPCDETDVLGFTIEKSGGIRVSDRSMKRFKYKVRRITKRNRAQPLREVIIAMNRLIVGWHNYFKLADVWWGRYKALDGWIRRRLRSYRLKQAGHPKAVRAFLHSLGVGKWKSWAIVRYSQGWWAMSVHPRVGIAMGIDWFSRQGLLMIYKRR